MKAEAAEKKKLDKEKQKWEKGKFALKSIVAEIDAKVVENGSVGGMPISNLIPFAGITRESDPCNVLMCSLLKFRTSSNQTCRKRSLFPDNFKSN